MDKEPGIELDIKVGDGVEYVIIRKNGFISGRYTGIVTRIIFLSPDDPFFMYNPIWVGMNIKKVISYNEQTGGERQLPYDEYYDACPYHLVKKK